MKRFLAVTAAAVAALAVAGLGLAASGDQGRRITGPICVGKPNAGALAGTMRSVARTQPCRSYEIRKLGVAAPDDDPPATPGPAGATGPQGPPGPAGSNGWVHIDQLTGDEANCVKLTGSDGSSGVICGAKHKQKPPCVVVEGKRHLTGAEPCGPSGPSGASGATGASGEYSP